jgi:hypothetical protein
MDEKKLSLAFRVFVVSTAAILVYLIPIQDDYAEQVSFALFAIVLFIGVIWCLMEHNNTFKFLDKVAARASLLKKDKEKRKLENEILRALSLKEAGVLSDDDAEQRISKLKARYNKI